MNESASRELIEFFNPPQWTTGHICLEDGLFLSDFIAKGLKTPVIEIGVASGWSSAVLLHCLRCNPPELLDERWLHSYDVGQWCYFDPNRRVGAAVEEVIPEQAHRWKLHVGNAIDAGLHLRGEDVEVAFIDADHRHPWPTLDLIALLPALAPGAWVALHDINLPEITTREDWKTYGPKHLFERWPWEKRLSDGVQRNTGAVKVPEDHCEVRSFCETVLSLPWETSVLKSIPEQLGLQVHEGYRIRSAFDWEIFARRIQTMASGDRPLLIWGAGSAGRKAIRSKEVLRTHAKAFIDSSSEKQGRHLEGLPILSPAHLHSFQPKPYVVITSQFANQIVSHLEGIGYRAEADFLVMEL